MKSLRPRNLHFLQHSSSAIECGGSREVQVVRGLCDKETETKWTAYVLWSLSWDVLWCWGNIGVFHQAGRSTYFPPLKQLFVSWRLLATSILGDVPICRILSRSILSVLLLRYVTTTRARKQRESNRPMLPWGRSGHLIRNCCN